MGQKTNPIGLRLGIVRSWNSKWFARKGDYQKNLLEDLMVRRYTMERLPRIKVSTKDRSEIESPMAKNIDPAISNIEILRSPKRLIINIYTARPGVVIGPGGARIELFKKELEQLTEKDIQLNVMEVNHPELDATLVARNIARQIEGRVSYRRAMKRAIQESMRAGADGVKIKCSGRLRGAEIAHSETYMDGRVPLHTLRADIDYATETAHTTYGCVGVKVWIFKGEILGGMKEVLQKQIKKKKSRRKRR
ncbi:30S ribosomal protein S3 [bacterium]|nr:30S ribosomal protein S3 [bacterium]